MLDRKERCLNNVKVILEWYNNEKIKEKLAKEWPPDKLIDKNKIRDKERNEIFKLFVLYSQFQQMKDEVVENKLKQKDVFRWWQEDLKIETFVENLKEGRNECPYLDKDDILGCIRKSAKKDSLYFPPKNPYCNCDRCILKISEQKLNRSKVIGAVPVSYVITFKEDDCSIVKALHKIDLEQDDEKIYYDAIEKCSEVIGVGSQIAGWFLRSVCKDGTDPDLMLLDGKLGEKIMKSAMKIDTHVIAMMRRYGIEGDEISNEIKILSKKFSVNSPGEISQALYAFDKKYKCNEIEKDKPETWYFAAGYNPIKE